MESTILLEDLHPAYQQLAGVVGAENAIKLGKELGGEQFYFPKIGTGLAKVRNRKIIAEFKGGNYVELARKYGVTSVYVRNLIKNNKRQRVQKNG